MIDFSVFEFLMIIMFGCSWPFNVIKSFKAKSTKGKSLLFRVFILVGYIFGIISKFINPGYMAEISTKWYVLASYFFNFTMVAIDFVLYFRNLAYDKKREKEAALKD